MKFHFVIYAALVLAVNTRSAPAQTSTATPKNVASSRKSVSIRLSVIAILPVYARALGIAPSVDAQENVIETSSFPIETRFALKDLSTAKKAIIRDEGNIAAFDHEETWANIIVSAPLEIKPENIKEEWKLQIETANKTNTFPNALREVVRLNVTPNLRGAGTFDLTMGFSRDLTFGPEKRVIHLIIDPDDTNKLIIAPESREYLHQRSATLQSQATGNFSFTAHNDETMAIFNLPSELSAQDFFANASPNMKIVFLVTPHIPRGNDPYVRAN